MEKNYDAKVRNFERKERKEEVLKEKKKEWK